MNYSYAMGVNDTVYELKSQGFTINKVDGDYEVSFPRGKESIWEDYIKNNLKVEFWNEYISSEKVVFLFSLEDGIKKYVVYNYDNDEVLNLCRKLCNYDFESIYKMLIDNDFYKEKFFHKN